LRYVTRRRANCETDLELVYDIHILYTQLRMRLQFHSNHALQCCVSGETSRQWHVCLNTLSVLFPLQVKMKLSVVNAHQTIRIKIKLKVRNNERMPDTGISTDFLLQFLTFMGVGQVSACRKGRRWEEEGGVAMLCHGRSLTVFDSLSCSRANRRPTMGHGPLDY